VGVGQRLWLALGQEAQDSGPLCDLSCRRFHSWTEDLR